MKTFIVIWFGQFISMLGSALSAFGLGIWIFQKTGSAESFAMSAVCTVLPALLFAPFAGPLADHVFEPLMQEKGRGISLIFVISGILLIISCFLMRLNKTVTSIEKRLPDYVDNQ